MSDITVDLLDLPGLTEAELSSLLRLLDRLGVIERRHDETGAVQIRVDRLAARLLFG